MHLGDQIIGEFSAKDAVELSISVDLKDNNDFMPTNERLHF
jgi:hypothetical protein